MEPYNTSIYPVFEADQVLSQKELNLLVSHLEEQDRITRKNLIGLGIVCGLELSFSKENNSVKIACGTAVTSLGFQINWKEQEFTQYHDFEISDQFLKADYTKEPYLDVIFKHASLYEPIKNCFELLPSDATDEDKNPITADFFNDKVVMLFLEVTLIDQKNCVTTNCDDKGKRIEFHLRPLVIPINELTEGLMKEYPLPDVYSKLTFPRYNVPYQNIMTASEVLNEFTKAFSDTFLNTINKYTNRLYLDFKNQLPQRTDLIVLENSKSKIEEILNSYASGIHIQYIWDWIFDIVEAYNEIIDFKTINPTLCCADEELFPFHVILGGNTSDNDVYKTPFIKILQGANEENTKRKELTLLFEKLVLIITSFEIPETNKIKVTPSSLGNVSLSKKAIPFYYEDILELNKKWNPTLTLKNQNDSLLSYHSDIANYSDKDAVREPLLFDIEPYNFFRIEGHIGMNYKTAVSELNFMKDSYGLPFKIIALNAVDFLNKDVDILEFKGRWDDLETDYDLARKRVYNITEFVINWMDQRRNTLDKEGIVSKQNIDNFKNILLDLKNLLTDDLKEFLPNYTSFYDIFKELNYVFLFHKWCIQLLKPTLSIIAEDLIDRLDDINELFLDDPFTVIYEEAYIRWEKTYKDLFFSTFLKKHPGMEHKAGVAKGGTFIMVYADSSIFKSSDSNPQYQYLLNTVKAYKNNIPIEESVKGDIIKNVDFKDYKSQRKTTPKREAIKKYKQETDSIKKDLLEIANNNLKGRHTPVMRDYIFKNIKEILKYESGSIPETISFQQVIIADFFLPYICCDEGEAMNTVGENEDLI